jgi:hypothetical protein
MKKFVFGLILMLANSAFACGGFGNGGTGCADKVLGVQTEAGNKIEIKLSGVSWFPQHICTGATTVQFAGTELEKNAALSIGMASYMSDKGPVFFRCTQKISNGICGCTNIVLGNTNRD